MSLHKIGFTKIEFLHFGGCCFMRVWNHFSRVEFYWCEFIRSVISDKTFTLLGGVRKLKFLNIFHGIVC